jgi:four helix bundle protein
MKDYKDWIVWQKAMELVEHTYKATHGFPHQEIYGLTSQMQRAVISIPSNIAEGYGRVMKKDKTHFYRISFASSRELETQIEISKRLGYLSDKEATSLQSLLLEVIKMLSKMVFYEKNI